MALRFGKRIKRRLVTDPVIWADSEPNEGDVYTVPDPPPGRMPAPETDPEHEDEDKDTPEPVHDPDEHDDPHRDPEPQSLSARRRAQQRKAAVRTYTRAEVQALVTEYYDKGYNDCKGVVETYYLAYECLNPKAVLAMMKEGLNADEARSLINTERAEASEETATRTMQMPDDGIEEEKPPQRQISHDMVKAAYANQNNTLFKLR